MQCLYSTKFNLDFCLNNNNRPYAHIQDYLVDRKQGIDKCWPKIATLLSMQNNNIWINTQTVATWLHVLDKYTEFDVL